ncbi:hypothetical protein SK3146_00371 [Paenibacillus konkukensis]|uniref:Uncharacterized protein n=2 Tax=Paenibacillus konkukensis TaxID=2020716 RepID=A0ABY4RGR1_9BACL|nr:hypothetical protein SK3146_00371 [Paenibacillus konkukensis]
MLAIVMLSSLLTGCWGLREIEHLIYVNSVGIDYANNKIVIYVQLASFFNIAKKEAGAQDEQQVISVARAEGETFDKAIFNLYATAQQRIAWSHVKTVLFSEAALNEKIINQVLDVWDRYYEFRYTNWVYATKDSIESVFYATPVQNISVVYSQLNDPNDTYSQNSVIEPLYLFDFMRSWYDKSQTLKVPFLKVTDNWTENQKVSPKLEMNGIGFFQNNRYLGDLPRAQTRGLRWFNAKLKRTNVFVRKDNIPQVMLVMEKVKFQIQPEMKEGKAQFRIKVSAQGNIPQLIQNLTEKQLNRLASEEIEKEIRESYAKGLSKGIDALNLSEVLFRAKPQDWHRLENNGAIPLDENSLASVEVDAKLYSGGISKIKKD